MASFFTFRFVFITWLCAFVCCAHSEEKPLRVLMVTHSMPNVSHTFIYNQAAGLIDRGVDVAFLAKLNNNNSSVNEIVKQYRLRDRTFQKLSDLELNSFDIIHFQFSDLACKWLRKIRSKGFEGGIVTAFRGFDLTNYMPENRKQASYLRQHSHLNLPVSQKFKEKLIQLGFDPNTIHVIYSGIDLDKFAYCPKPPPVEGETIEILSVGRLVEKKGHAATIQAVNIVRKLYPNVRLTIIGGGCLKSQLHRLIKRLRLGNHVKLLGKQSIEVVTEHLRRSHLFVLASQKAANGNQEGIPNALKEAMATGLPVISTYHSGIPELIDNGVDGFLVPEKKYQALAKKIIYLIENPQIWESIGLQAHKKIASEYDKELVNEKYYQLLQDVKNERPID